MLTVQNIITCWIKCQERKLGKLVINIRLDNAREFVALKLWAEGLGIDLEFTEAYMPL